MIGLTQNNIQRLNKLVQADDGFQTSVMIEEFEDPRDGEPSDFRVSLDWGDGLLLRSCQFPSIEECLDDLEVI